MWVRFTAAALASGMIGYMMIVKRHYEGMLPVAISFKVATAAFLVVSLDPALSPLSGIFLHLVILGGLGTGLVLMRRVKLRMVPLIPSKSCPVHGRRRAIPVEIGRRPWFTQGVPPPPRDGAHPRWTTYN